MISRDGEIQPVSSSGMGSKVSRITSIVNKGAFSPVINALRDAGISNIQVEAARAPLSRDFATRNRRMTRQDAAATLPAVL